MNDNNGTSVRINGTFDHSTEDSNSSSGVTTEELCPELNLDLSIGLPQQQPQIIKNESSNQKIGTTNNYYQYFSGTQTVCLCCNLGFQNINQGCSCKSMSTIIRTADLNLYRYYRPSALDS